MPKVFQSIVTTALDGRELFAAVDSRTVREEPLDDKTIDVTWDNVDDVLKEYGPFLPFRIAGGMLGPRSHRIEFNPLQVRGFIRIKRREAPNPGIRVKVHWVETSCPFEYPMTWTDGDKAVRYLAMDDDGARSGTGFGRPPERERT